MKASNINNFKPSLQALIKLSLVCFGVASSTLAYSQQPSPSADDVSANQVFHGSASQEAGTGGGGPWVVEQESRWTRGEITAIEVCFGSYVEKMTVFYGGVRGTTMGNMGANVGCKMWEAPKNGYLKSIYVWSGKYMDAIQFHPSEGEPSPRFGGNGGGRTVVEDSNNGAVRMIDAKSGAYLDRIRVHFGLPYYITNIKPDYDALRRQIDGTKPERIDMQTVDACQSNRLARQNITVQKRLTESHSFKFSNTTAIGLKTAVEGGFGGIIKASVETSINTAFTVEKANAFETGFDYSRNISADAGAGEKVNIVTVSKSAKLDLPFTYDMVHYRNGNRQDKIKTQSFKGVYKGNQAADTNTKQISIDCETNQPISVASQRTGRGGSSGNASGSQDQGEWIEEGWVEEEWEEETWEVWFEEESEDQPL